ncbi:MAG TPA: hypothetical protein IAA71_08275, partial [Candidatus Pullichristensenella stercoripullorum]|nr:hypothetical protein [Candidatus Pullichristensenella stercoripullorum]
FSAMNVEIYNPDDLPEEFIRAEIAQAEKEQNRKARRAEFYRVDDGNAREVFYWHPVEFQRIRRITGYLVGTIDRWNDAKRAEEKDRVKHACC